MDAGGRGGEPETQAERAVAGRNESVLYETKMGCKCGSYSVQNREKRQLCVGHRQTGKYFSGDRGATTAVGYMNYKGREYMDLMDDIGQRSCARTRIVHLRKETARENQQNRQSYT